MDFSESYKASNGPTPCYSPDGRYLASTVEYRLIIREAESLRIVQLYSCLDRISCVSWAPNSLYVLCGLHARGVVQVWSTDQPDWACKIDEGPAGVSHVMWTPDGMGVVILAEFQIRTTVWSLMDRTCTYLRGTKHQDKGCAFSPDGSTFSVLERHECKDYVTLYSTKGWQQIAHTACDTHDAVDLCWSPNGSYLAIWDSSLNYGVCILNSLGQHVTHYSAYQDALGVKSMAWNPSGEMLAVGSYDQVLRLLNHVTWGPLMEVDHPSKVLEPDHVVVYREVVEATAASPGGRTLTPTKSPGGKRQQSKYVVDSLPASIPTSTPCMDEHAPQLGIGRVAWSPDSQFLATQNDNMPGSLWIWDMATMELSAILHHMSDILDAKWAPQVCGGMDHTWSVKDGHEVGEDDVGCMLAAVAGGSKVYLWTPAGASIVHIPLKNFNAHKIVWNPCGSSVCLTDREAFCCAYL